MATTYPYSAGDSSDWRRQPGLAPVLRRVNACNKAVKWAGRRRISRTAYNACPRGDWLLWLAGHIDVERKLVVLAACDCAEQALPLVPAGEDWPRAAIAAARAWCDGRATRDDLRAAASGAAWVAARAATGAGGAETAVRAAESAIWAAIWAAESARADYDAAGVAAGAAADAAKAAEAARTAGAAEASWSVDAAVRTVVRAAEAAEVDCDVAGAAADVAEAAGDAAWYATLRDCAKLVRARLPWVVMRDAMLAVAAEVHAS